MRVWPDFANYLSGPHSPPGSWRVTITISELTRHNDDDAGVIVNGRKSGNKVKEIINKYIINYKTVVGIHYTAGFSLLLHKRTLGDPESTSTCNNVHPQMKMVAVLELIHNIIIIILLLFLTYFSLFPFFRLFLLLFFISSIFLFSFLSYIFSSTIKSYKVIIQQHCEFTIPPFLPLCIHNV